MCTNVNKVLKFQNKKNKYNTIQNNNYKKALLAL